MRSVFLFVPVFLLCPLLQAQSLLYANKLIEYRPAPGQFINDSSFGTPDASHKILNGIGNPLSLGAYGGYVVLGFNSGIMNHPDNPYGVDFIIYGNASATHAEPGIIQVMKDDNLNGLPDDTWYEIAGSAHSSGELSLSYTISYVNPVNPLAADVTWTDNKGSMGKVYKNSYHNQPYYPLKELFPAISNETLSFSGSKLEGNVHNLAGTFISDPYAFGYADMLPVKNQTMSGIPDNPYTRELIEGDGGDGIDISWAIDEMGEYVNLSEINFIKISTGVNESAGWLGEISTDIRGIVDIVPDKNITGPGKMILTDEIPKRIAFQDSIELFGRVFISGKPAKDEKITWESLNPAILQVSNNRLIAISSGVAEIKGTLLSDPSVFVRHTISVVIPKSLSLDNEKTLIQVGEKVILNYSLIDNTGEKIDGIIPEIIVDNTDIVYVANATDCQIAIIGMSAGSTLISLSFQNYPEIQGSLEIQVINKIDAIQLTFSLGDENRNIIPAKIYTVEKADILSFTDRHQNDFNPDKPYITLADAIACVLKTEGFGLDGGKSMAFRQDEYGGSGLYLWQVGFDWEYQYGWGGSKKDDSYAKTWFAVVNDKVFASGFDTIEVRAGDRISLRHIEDNKDAWNFLRIIPEKAEVVIDESINFLTEQIDVFPTENGEFTVSGPFPFANGLVNVERSFLNSESDQFTSYTGEFNLSFRKGGKFEVAVENSEPVVVDVSFPLLVEQFWQDVMFYPNPCREEISINNPSGEGFGIRIFSIDGSLKVQTQIEKGCHNMQLNLSDLEKGLYVLEWFSGGKSNKHKLIKP